MTSPSGDSLGGEAAFGGCALLPDGRSCRARVLAMSCGISLAAVLLIFAYLRALLRLSPDEWWTFAVAVLVLFPILFVAQAWVQRKLWDPLVRCLDLRVNGRAGPQQVREGFAAASNLALRSFAWGGLWWALGGLLVSGAMLWRHPHFSAFSSVAVVAAALSGGLVMMLGHYFLMKRMLEPVRLGLAAEIPDPAERSALVTRVPLAGKTALSLVGVTLVCVGFSVMLAQVRSARPLEAYASQVHAKLLEALAADLEQQGERVLSGALDRARRLGIADALGVLDAAGERVVAGSLGPLLPEERRAMTAAGLTAGDSTGFDSPNVSTWRRLPDGRVLVAVSTWKSVGGGRGELFGVFLVFLLVSTLVALGIASLLSQDLSRATERLRGEAERLASGDLRIGGTYESEDELGELSRSFAGMSSWLRATVSRLAEAADRVEGTAGTLSGLAEGVAGVTADQVSGLSQATSSMESIDAQVRGIASSSQALNGSVEESSSSILELGASGEELNETAVLLSSKVEEVSSSIEQMVRSVKQVVENTGALSEAAEETSGSMEEMASALREVDATVAETSRLSDQVVSSAERGQAKVSQTIQGMEAIREATETAERVIRHLGGRTEEIGAIVDVIDDVADETNLLALNAAIIAAQAGEQGRAFSVVADEIKDLAERVLASTKEIGGLIRSLQEEAGNAIGAIERGASSVASGVDLSAEAGMSLEEITRASRESGTRMGAIVGAVREQARAAGHVVELMERVRGGVAEIRTAAAEQDRGNVVVYQGAVTMREVSAQVRGTTEEQARGSVRIRQSVEGVRDAVERINEALQEQSRACAEAVELLETVHGRTRSNEEAARQMDSVAKEILAQAEALRADVRRFQV